MHRFKLLSVTVIGALALLGCATPPTQHQAGPTIRPFQSLRHAADPQTLYLVGRYFQGQLRYEQAIDAYRQLLSMQPFHADAHSALGVIYSMQARPDLAEGEFSAALAATPNAAAHNNYGYHLMLTGQIAQALAMFEQARSLEPENPLVRANLVIARRQLGMPDEVQPPSDLPPPAVAMTSTVTPAEQPVAVPTMHLDSVLPGVWELRPPAATANGETRPQLVASVAAPSFASSGRMEVFPRNALAEPSRASSPAAEAGRIEIANANGATGLAKRVWGLLAPMGLVPARLTNDKPYGTVTSRIQYVDGAKQIAEEVNAGLPLRLPLARVAALERNARIRLLLGKDYPLGPQPAAGAQEGALVAGSTSAH